MLVVIHKTNFTLRRSCQNVGFYSEQELLADRESMYQFQLEKEQQYNEMIVKLKDQVRWPTVACACFSSFKLFNFIEHFPSYIIKLVT